MDFVIETLKQLFVALSDPGTLFLFFVLVSASAYLLHKIFVKAGGRISFNNEKQFASIESHLKILIDNNGRITDAIESIVDAIKATRDEEREDSNDIQIQFEEFSKIQEGLAESKDELIKEIELLKSQMKVHDSATAVQFAFTKETLETLLDNLNETSKIVDQLDGYLKIVIQDFKTDNKDLNRALADLSKDIKVIETLVKTQASNVGVTLR